MRVGRGETVVHEEVEWEEGGKKMKKGKGEMRSGK